VRLALACLLVAACAPAQPDEFACDETCDSDGPLQLSGTWVPEGGFVRATVKGGHTLVVTPREGAVIEPRDKGRSIVRFDAPGYFRITAGSGSIGVRVSDEGPSIALDPIGTDGYAKVGKVRVTGTVVDPLGLGQSKLLLGSQRVTVDDRGFFDFTIPAEFGVEILDLVVVDEVGNRFQEPRSFIAAAGYGASDPRTVLGFSQSAVDRIAAELSAGLGPLLTQDGPAEPVYESFLADVYVDTYDFPSDTKLTLVATSAGLRAQLDIASAVVVRGRIQSGVTSTFSAAVPKTHVEGLLRPSSAGGKPTLLVDEVTVSTAEPDIEVTGIIPDAVFSWLVGSVDQRVATAVQVELPKVLDELIASTAGTFDVNVPNMSRELQGRYALQGIRIGSTGAEIDLATSIDVPAGAGPGAPLADYAVSQLPTTTTDAVLLEQNFINQYLFALWRAGGFVRTFDETELDEALGEIPALAELDPVIDIQVSATQPPVATSTDAGLELSVGNVELVVSVSTDYFQVVARGSIAARAAVDGAVDGFALAPKAAMEVLHIDIDQQAFAGLDTERLEALVEKIAPQLIDEWAKKIKSIDLPTLKLDELGTPGRFFGLQTAAGSGSDAGVLFRGKAVASQ